MSISQGLGRLMPRMGAKANAGIATLDDGEGGKLKEVGNWLHDWDIKTPTGNIKEIITLQFASDGKQTVLLNKNVTNYVGDSNDSNSAGKVLNDMFKKTAVIMDGYGTSINKKALPAALGQATARMAIIAPDSTSTSQQIQDANYNLSAEEDNRLRDNGNLTPTQSANLGGKKMKKSKTSKTNEIIKRRRRRSIKY